MARVFSTNTTAASKYPPMRPRISINWYPPFRPHFIKLSKTVFYEVNLTSQHSHLEVLLQSKFWSERGDTDSWPLMYVLWCCGSICHQLFNSIQIGCGHTVIPPTQVINDVIYERPQSPPELALGTGLSLVSSFSVVFLEGSCLQRYL